MTTKSTMGAWPQVWLEKIEQRGPDECWPWRLFRDPKGYGLFKLGGRRGRTMRAHRYAYELAYGPIPEGQLVCHRCDNPSCCNPEHLFLGTPAENSADMVRKGRSPNRVLKTQPWARLTEETVLHIRADHQAGKTYREIAAEYGVGKTTVESIVRRRTWRHLG
jgi:hypothetical protein